MSLGADYVIHSLTKYCCGHGDAMGGAVLASEEHMRAIETDGQIHVGGDQPLQRMADQQGVGNAADTYAVP